MKKAALYVRVSTQEQKNHGLSVDNQIEALQEYCQINNMIIAGIYNDAGISARKTYKKRPELLRLIADCQANKVDIILFTKLDRFFRSVPDYYACIEQMNNKPWRAIWEDYETETSSGIFKVNIMLSVAQSEADRTSERIKHIVEYRRNKGDYVGSAPTGYKVKDGKLVKDEALKDIIDCIFSTYFKTKSISQCAKVVNEKYNTHYTYFVIRKFMRNPAYMGTANNGFKCEPYITPKQYDFIMENIGKNAPRETKFDKRIYIFSGLLVCGDCGHRIVGRAARRKLKSGEIVPVKNYVCEYSMGNNLHPSICISEPKLENYIINALDAMHDIKSREIRLINASMLNKSEAAATKKKLEAKLKRLLLLFEEGDITEADYKIKRDKIKLEISALNIEPLAAPTPLPKDWRSIYNDLDDEHKHQFFCSVIKKITISSKNKACPDIDFL